MKQRIKIATKNVWAVIKLISSCMYRVPKTFGKRLISINKLIN